MPRFVVVLFYILFYLALQILLETQAFLLKRWQNIGMADRPTSYRHPIYRVKEYLDWERPHESSDRKVLLSRAWAYGRVCPASLRL